MSLSLVGTEMCIRGRGERSSGSSTVPRNCEQAACSSHEAGCRVCRRAGRRGIDWKNAEAEG